MKKEPKDRTSRPPRILLAGGGTGGHVYPAIAIADALRILVPDAAIAFAGTKEKLEWKAVPKAGYPIHPITIQGFHRKNLVRNLSFPTKLLKGLIQSWTLIGAFDPDIVVGTGGYVSGPVLYAAHMRKRPVVIQEQNAYPGVTNRILSKYAHTVHVAFKAAITHFGEATCIISGNPTRDSLKVLNPEDAREHFSIPESGQVLLVFGGSLGSAAINAQMERMLSDLLNIPSLYVIWQTGSIYYENLVQRIDDHPRLRLLQYIDRMDFAYAASDLVLARSGAITCSELAVTGTPSILIPSPNVAEDHQTKNALSMEEAGASVRISEEEMSEKVLAQVKILLEDSSRRESMRAAAHSLSRPDAAQHIATSILQLLDN